MSLILPLRLCGASQLVLALFHLVLWRAFDWGPEISRLSPLNARVFIVHMFFIVLVLCGLGMLSLGRPQLLLVPSELARLLLYGIVVFWLLRLLLQPLVFDPALSTGWARHRAVRWGASLLWTGYVATYGAALLRQLGVWGT
jgi:hypothetical protein